MFVLVTAYFVDLPGLMLRLVHWSCLEQFNIPCRLILDVPDVTRPCRCVMKDTTVLCKQSSLVAKDHLP